jgi:hypothetical protein
MPIRVRESTEDIQVISGEAKMKPHIESVFSVKPVFPPICVFQDTQHKRPTFGMANTKSLKEFLFGDRV